MYAAQTAFSVLLIENFSVSEAKVPIKATKEPIDSDDLCRNVPQSRLSTIEIMTSRYKTKF